MSAPIEYLNAKLRGRRSKLYEGERLRELAGAENLERLCGVLYPGEDITKCTDLERRIRRDCIDELLSLLPFLTGRAGCLYYALLERFRVENLKLILRYALSERKPEGGDVELLELPPKLSLPVKRLLSISNAADFVANIEDKTIRSGAAAGLPLYEKTQNKAFIEMGLDRGYWKGVHDALGRLPAWEREECLPPLENEAFSLRLLCVLRAARIYELEWADVEPVLGSSWHKPSPATLRRVHQDPSPESVLKNVSHLSRLGLSSHDLQSIPKLEESLWKATVDIANRQYYRCMDSPAILVSYFYLKRAEAKRLAGLAEMLRYGAQRREIAEFLGVDASG